MSTSNQDGAPWSDFEGFRHGVKSYTVDKLKQILTGLSEENGVSLPKNGKKQDLIDRITQELDRYRYNRDAERWSRAKGVLLQVRTSGTYTSSGTNQTFTANHSFIHNNSHGSAYAPPRAPSGSHHPINNVGGSSIARYDPYAPPRRPFPPSAPSVPPVNLNPNLSVPIRFKASPFYKVDQTVSSVVECPESTGSMDRRNQVLNFMLTQEHINKLASPSVKYQLRLYCTTNTFYSPSPSGFRSNTSLCPIEFPATCEVRVNNTLLQANLKGIKKKPGTAPPADISKFVRMGAGQNNRIDMIYVNSQANSQANASPKKFYLVVQLVEVSSVDQLVDRLRKGKFRTMEEIKTQMVSSGDVDDDIVVGKQKMTLKCPLSYTRISVPCRSDKCVHSQCFDAISWYSVMEQTSTWLCPVCEKQLNPEELIVDGYFGSILQQTPESVEEVEVEPDGEWHTGDNKMGSKTWMDTHRSKQTASSSSASKRNLSGNIRVSPSPSKAASSSLSSISRSLGEVVILDSDSENEDETRVKKELSPTESSPISMGITRNGIAAATSKGSKTTVIDLTLDSDDEDMPTPTPVVTSKRKAPEVFDPPSDTAAAYKKSRPFDPQASAGGKDASNGYPERGSSTSSGAEPYPNLVPLTHQRPMIPLPRQVSSSSTSSHHRSPPGASSPPMYYSNYASAVPNQSTRPFIQYQPYPPQEAATNGAALPPNDSTADPIRQRSGPYNPYLSRSNGSGGSGWP